MKEKISRREALKRIAIAAVLVTPVSVLSANGLRKKNENNTLDNLAIGYNSFYYHSYSSYYNYSSYVDYQNYGRYCSLYDPYPKR